MTTVFSMQGKPIFLFYGTYFSTSFQQQLGESFNNSREKLSVLRLKFYHRLQVLFGHFSIASLSSKDN